MRQDKFLTEEETSHLEVFLKRRLKAGRDVRNALMLLLSLKTGARASEVLALRKEDVDAYTRSVCVIGLKGGNNRQLPLEPMLFKALMGYVSIMGEGELLFPISYNRYWQIWQEYRPVRKKLHALRHSVGVKVYSKSKDVHLVKTILGHKNIQTSMIYMDFVESQAKMRKVLL